MYYVPQAHHKIMTDFVVRTGRGELAADMGLGKTGGVLAAVDIANILESNCLPSLILAPKRVSQVVWPGELEKWSRFEDLTLTDLTGEYDSGMTKKGVFKYPPCGPRLDALRRPITDLYAINYDNVPWLVDQFKGKRWPFRWVIADEATKLKSFRLHAGGVRANALSKIARSTERWTNLTGTMIPNGYQDLWGQYWFLDFGQRLGRTYTHFMQTYFSENPYTREIKPLPGAVEQIQKQIADITCVLRAEDWLDLLKPLETVVEVALPPEARKHYREMEKNFFVELGDDGIEAPTAAAQSTKLLQLASGGIYEAGQAGAKRRTHAVHEEKIEALQDIVREVNENILVVYMFQFDIARIKGAFPNARVMESKQDIDDWNAGKIPMMLIHPQSGGHGLNLQWGGRTIVFFSQTWNLEHRLQVFERIGPARQAAAGFKRVVRVFDIIARQTLDVEARDRVKTKCSVQDALKAARARRS